MEQQVIAILGTTTTGIVGIVLNAAGKSENFFKPIVVSILKPVGLIKDKETVAPELTNTRTTTVS